MRFTAVVVLIVGKALILALVVAARIAQERDKLAFALAVDGMERRR